MWTSHAKTKVFGGQIAKASTVDDCKAKCAKNDQCTGVDWDQRSNAGSHKLYVRDAYGIRCLT